MAEPAVVPAPPPEEDAPEPPERRPFAAWLTEQRNGSLHAELSEALASVVEAVTELNKQGTVTLKVTVKPIEDGSGAAVFVSDEVKTSPPEPARPQAMFFADSRGNLSRRDPRQVELPLRRVGGAQPAASGQKEKK